MTATTPDVPDVPPLPEEMERRFPVQAIWAGVAALVVGLVGGYFIGHGTANSGPSSLADALSQSANGSLPRGDVTGTLQQLGGIRALLGTGGARAAGGGTGTGGTGTGGTGTGGTGTGGTGGGGTGGGRGGFGVAGTVNSINGNVITITTTAGQVKVLVSGSTTYAKTVAAAQTDVTQGERVTVRPDFTSPSSGGQTNAASVIIQPAASTTTGTAGQ